MKLWFRPLLGVALALCLAAAAHAQLTISNVSAVPPSAKPGDTVTFTVTVLNTDALTASTQGTANFNIQLSNQATGQTINLGTSNLTVAALAAGGTVEILVSKTIPLSSSQAGDCKVTATMSGGAGLTLTIGTAGSYSFQTSASILTIVGKPDLKITSLTYPAGTAYKGGDVIPMQLQWTNLVNSGNNNVPYVPNKNGDATFFRIEVILSSNPTFGDGDDFLLTSFDIGSTENADGLNRTLNWNQLLPGNFAGSYYVMAKIDTLSGVSEVYDNDLSLNGNNTWFNDTNAARINLLPTNFPTDYWASTSGNAYSDNPAISSDGRYVAFASDSTNLGTVADTNGVRDIFLYDNQNATVRRINLSQQGVQANGASNHPAISSDGRYVAFASEATNLIVGDTNGFSDIFVVDSITGTIARESVTTAGGQANGSNFKPSISADGRYVVFESSATNLVSPATAVGVTHLYLRDRTAATTTLVDRATGVAGAVGNGGSLQASISANGRYVAFASDATNLVAGDTNSKRDIFVRDLTAATTIRVSVSTAGTEGNAASRAPSISATGRFIAFGSEASNLVAGDTNAVSDIFVYDRDVNNSGTFDTGGNVATRRVSVSSAGAQAADPSGASFHLGSVNPSISSDGRYVTFASLADNLAVGDSGGQTQNLYLTNAGNGAYATAPAISLVGGGGSGATATATVFGGFVVAVTITNPGSGYTSAPTVVFDNTGTGGNGAAATAFANPNGYVTGPDANDAVDVFVVDRDVAATGTYDTPGNIATSMVSVNRFGYQTQQLLGVPSSAASDIYPVISADGRWVALPSDAENTAGLVHGANNRSSPDLNTFRDVFLHDRRINALPNAGISPIVTIAAQSPVLVNTAVTVSASATTTIGVIRSVDFYVNGTLLGSTGVFPYTAAWTPTAVGTYTLTALATDIFGNIGVSTNLPVTVNAAPAVSITSPVGGSTITLGATPTVTATAAATTPGATIVSVQFYANGAAIGLPSAGPSYSRVWTPTSTGTFTLIAVATDSIGTTTTSAAVTVAVSSGPATPPDIAIGLPADAADITVNVPQTVTATATPAVGTAIASVQFFANGLSLGTVTAFPYTVSWTPLTPGTYTVVAVAIDSNGTQTTSAAHTVTVKSLAPPSVSLASPGATVAANSTVTLTATATATTGTTIARVQFFDNGQLIGTANTFPYTVSWTPALTGGHILTARAFDNTGNFADNTVTVLVAANQIPTVTAPLSSLGANPGVGLANTISVASATDVDGTVAQVEFFANGVSIGVDPTSPFSIAWTPRLGGTYNLTAVATDNLGALSLVSAPTTVTVSGGNAPTGVALTAPANPVAINNPQSLSATATAVVGTIASVQFFVATGGGAPVSLGTDDTYPYTATWTPTAPGSYSLTAVATDSVGNQTVSATVVRTATLGQPPAVTIVNPNANGTYVASKEILFDATASDPDGTITKVEFIANGVIVATDTNSPYFTNWTPQSPGTYTLIARATDNSGNVTDSASITITVTQNIPPVINLLSPANATQFTAGSPIVFFATATDANGTINNVRFLANGDLIGAAVTTAPYTTLWTPTIPGAYTILAIAVDNDLNAATSPTRTVTIIAPVGQLPTVAITSPAAGSSLTTVSTVPIIAGATDPDGTVASVAFYDNGVLLNTILAAPFTVNWTPGSAGTHRLVAVVTDNSGNIVSSAPVDLTVTAGTSQPPTVTLANPGPQISGATVNLTATASDPDGTVASVQFLVNGAALSTDATPPFTATWVPTQAGTYRLTAIATDNSGNQTVSVAVNVTVTASSVPVVEITSPAGASTVVVGNAQTITATATSTNGTVSQVAFYVNGAILGVANQFPYAISWTPVTTGPYILTAIGTDNHGNEGSATPVSVTVGTSTGTAPTVTFTSPAALSTLPVNATTSIAVDANATAGLTIARVQFYANGAPLGTITGFPYVLPWTPLATGSYVLSAVATDTLGNQTTASRSVTVSGGTPPTVTVSSPTGGATYAVGNSISLSAQVALGSGLINNFKWFANGVRIQEVIVTPGGQSGGAPPFFNFLWAPAAAGSYVITGVATDTTGNVASSAAVTVTVNVIAAPTVTITSPGISSTVAVNTTQNLTATATSAGGTIVSVEFFANGRSIGADTTFPYSVSWTPTSAGTFLVTAVATDNLGSQKTSSVSTITVVPGSASLPYVYLTATPTGTNVTVNTPVAITANAGDPDGSVANVQFYVNGQVVGAAANAPYYAVWVPTAAGPYTLTAVVTDNAGNRVTSAPAVLTALAQVGSVPVAAIDFNRPKVDVPGVGATPDVIDPLLPVAVTFGSKLIISAAAVDQDGTIASVQFFANGTSLATDSAAPYYTIYALNTLSDVVLTALVTDSSGNTIYTSPIFIAPQAAVGADTAAVTLVSPLNGSTYAVSSQILFSGTHNFGNVNPPKIDFYVNGHQFSTTTTAPYQTIVGLTRAGTYDIHAVGRSGDTTTVSSVAQITVTSNTAPLVSITSPASGSTYALGAPLTIQASASDTDGTIGSVQFFVNGALLSSKSTAPYTASWNPGAPGNYTLRSIAIDDAGNQTLSNPVTVTITGNALPTVAITSPGAATSVVAGTLINLAASAADADGTVVSVSFLANGSPVGTATSSPFAISWRPTVAGAYSITAVATDNLGSQTTSTPLSLTVTGTAAPTVTITSPTALVLPVNIPQVITANANSTSGTIASVQFVVNGVTIGTDTVYPYEAPWTPVSPGTYTLRAIAIDNSNNVTTSPAVTVTVTASTLPTVTLASPANGASLSVNAAQSIVANVVPGSLAVTGVEFSVNGASLGTDTTYPYSVNWTPTNLGSYVLTAVVTDALGNKSTPATATVTATASAGATVVSLVAGTTSVPQGSSVVLRAEPSANQGIVRQVQFFDNGVPVGSPDTTAPYFLVYTPSGPSGATHDITAQATDSNNVLLPASAAVRVTVISAVTPLPTVAITSPRDNVKIPVPDYITDQAAAVTITVDAQKPSGRITKVELYIDGEILRDKANVVIGIKADYPYTYTWQPTVAGTFHLVALAYDDKGNIVASNASTTVSSTPVPVSVIVTAPPAATILAPTDFSTVSGGAITQASIVATSSNGYPVNVQLFFDDKYVGEAVIIAAGTPASVPFTPIQKKIFDGAGNLVVIPSKIYVVASDPLGFSSTTKATSITLNVTDGGSSSGTIPNGAPPDVSIIEPLAGNLPVGAPVTLSANAADSDGNIASVEFRVNNQIVGAALTAYPYHITWTPANLGSYAVTAKATDDKGNTTTSAPVTVTVTDSGPNGTTVSITAPTSSSTFTAGTATTLKATATDDVSVANVQFFVNGQPLGAPLTASPYNLGWTPVTAGSYTIVARATDNVGNQATSAAVTVTVNPNASPSVSLTSPQASTVVAGTTVALAATASDSDGTVTTVKFFANNILVAAVNSSPYTTTWTPGAAGSYTLFAQATDDSGNTTNSATVVLTVGANQAPTVSITSPANGGVYRVGVGATVTATASDIDGTIASVQFRSNGAVIDTLTTAPFRTTWVPTSEGVYALTAVATDNTGATTTSAAVTVLAAIISSATSDTVYNGSYAALGESGGFAAINLHGRTATLIGYVPAIQTLSTAKTYYFANVPIDASGGFTQRDAGGVVLISGHFSDTGVSGTFDNGRVTFIGPSTSSSSTAVAAGYYSGSIIGHYASVLTGLVGLDGTITLYLKDGAFVDSGAGAVDSTGAFTINTRAGNKFVGKADPATGFLSGTLTGAASGTFAAALPSGNTFSDGFLRNISTRGLAGTGNNILIAGFVVNGTVPKQILIRAIGPSMGSGLTGLLPDPQLQLFTSAGAAVAGSYNNDWGSNAAALSAIFAQVGAFALPPASKDAAVALTLAPGVYSAQISDVNGATGLALVELYDVDNQSAFSSQKMVNISTRGQVGTGNNILIAGFVVNGTSPKKVLVRGVGPGFAQYFPAGTTLADPILRIVRPSDNLVVRENDNWEVGNDATLIVDAAAKVGASPLTSGSKDAVILMTLPPGIYSAQLFGANSGTGIGLVEVYEVP
jgi:hypothetical protein